MLVSRAAVSALLFAALLAILPPASRPLQAQTDDAARAIDQIMSAVYPAAQPGAALIVIKDDRVILRKAYGLANLELQAPLLPEHVFALASLSKPFTAAAILALAEDGRLALTDDITRFLPGYPTHGARITIEHLLTHTSGLSALSETSDLRATAVQESPLIDVLGDWTKDLPLDFQPGDRWAYSNWGYNLLGAIVERASGLTYAAYLQQRLFAPAGMTHTSYNDRRAVIAGRVTGYDQINDRTVNLAQIRSRIFLPGGAASLLSTVDDLAAWNRALADARVLTPASMARMFTSFRLNDGTPTHYGYGWDLGTHEGHRVQEHAGGTYGFQSFMVRMPDDGVFVAILSNRSFATPPIQATAHRVAALALGLPVADPTPVAVTAADLDRITGTYRGSDVGTFTVTRDGASAVVQAAALGAAPLPLVPTGPLTYRTTTVLWTWTFELGDNGTAARARVREWKIDDVAARVATPAPLPPGASPTRPPAIAPTEAELMSCVGEYEALGGILATVARRGDHLTVTPLGQAGVEIYPGVPTAAAPESGDAAGARLAFVTADGRTTYRFVTDADGRVTGYWRRANAGTSVPARRIR